MDLMLATSKAGHDKNQTYIILEEDNGFYLIANGTTKTIARPKKKKKIHLQIIKNIPSEILDEVQNIKVLDDTAIKRILKVYNRRNQDV